MPDVDPTRPLQPASLFQSLIEADLNGSSPAGGVIVGPVNQDQITAGCIRITQLGEAKEERYVPVLYARLEIRVLAPSLATVDELAQKLKALYNDRNRVTVTQGSNGLRYLVHSIGVDSGPTPQYNSPEYFASLIRTRLMIGTMALDV
jgi:hypothetical protein